MGFSRKFLDKKEVKKLIRKRAIVYARSDCKLQWHADGSMGYLITFPIQVQSEANAHDVNRFVTHSRKQKQQEHFMLYMHGIANVIPKRVPTSVKFIRLSPGLLDTDNLAGAFKHVRDELARYFGVDDGPTGPIEWKVDQRRQPAVGIEMEILWSKDNGPESTANLS